MSFGHRNELKARAENERDAERLDVVIVVFCACLVLAWFLGGLLGASA